MGRNWQGVEDDDDEEEKVERVGKVDTNPSTSKTQMGGITVDVDFLNPINLHPSRILS